ncbi:MAG TPA: DUF4386 family protein [Ktedonobacterales bacterium]|nr:DUF4386 family protein [Ktedonobacterales bacterium]
METARLKVQGIYSLLAGLVLLVGVPIYQAAVLGPAGYRAPSDTAFNHGDYGPLLGWISGHGSAFIFFRVLELLIFLLVLRLPLALYRAFRGYGSMLARWMLAGGLGGLILFAGMLALSTISFVNASASYGPLAPSSAAARDVASNFGSIYGIEALAQNTAGGALLAIFLLCASLLFARSGKLQGLLVYFGLLAAALMAALALLFAVSPPDAQTQLTTPSLAAFAFWLIWLGILLIRRAPHIVAAPIVVSPETVGPSEATASGTEAPQAPQENQP